MDIRSPACLTDERRKLCPWEGNVPAWELKVLLLEPVLPQGEISFLSLSLNGLICKMGTAAVLLTLGPLEEQRGSFCKLGFLP